MLRRISLFSLLALLAGVSPALRAQVVVPVGESIKPEGGGGGEEGVKKAVKKRKVAPASVVKPGSNFMIQMATVVSSGLSKPGETVYFLANEDVGSGKPVIASGAVGRGTIKNVQADKKKGKLTVALDSIQAVNGESVPVGGDVTVEGQGGQAAIAFGDKFTATLDEKVVIRPKPAPRAKKGEEVPEVKKANVEIRGKGVKVDIRKGSAKGSVEIVLEAPKGMMVDDVDVNSVALTKVNSFSIPSPVRASADKAKVGDRNKNGVTDLNFSIEAWDFVKYQPRGNNVVTISGRMKNGTPFEASSGVTIDY
ncbi:MAG: hypothetical protein U1F66_03485 [bacterium]